MKDPIQGALDAVREVDFRVRQVRLLWSEAERAKEAAEAEVKSLRAELARKDEDVERFRARAEQDRRDRFECEDWQQVDDGLLAEWDACQSADGLLWLVGLIGVDPAMVDIARSSVYAEHSRESCKDHHGDRVRQLIPRIVVAEALARNRIQKPQSARGEADGQDLATAEGERS